MAVILLGTAADRYLLGETEMPKHVPDPITRIEQLRGNAGVSTGMMGKD